MAMKEGADILTGGKRGVDPALGEARGAPELPAHHTLPADSQEKRQAPSLFLCFAHQPLQGRQVSQIPLLTPWIIIF